ncbi:hypothetical protein M2150_002850 [Lachnospiraceae bacterium PM6-15]|uniref:hypothetical protein n=1 Tax=Ohessyouella blattaphilus TaxID=2949333 RepID=UPI003E285593
MNQKKETELLEALVSNQLLDMLKGLENNRYGITQEYNRDNRAKLWDDNKAKQLAKDNAFGDKKTYKDPISGDTLHYKSQNAKNKYHMKNKDGEKISTAYAKHVAESDHTIALKEYHKRVKKIPFLDDEDLKYLANKQSNLKVISKRLNTKKGSKSDLELLSDNELSLSGKKALLKTKAVAEIDAAAATTIITAKNIGHEALKGGIDILSASAVPLVVESVGNLCAIVNGEKEAKEAICDIGELTVSIGRKGAKTRVVSIGVINIFESSDKEILQNLGKSGQVTNMIIVAEVIQGSVIKLLSGDISGKEFMTEICDKGVGTLTSQVSSLAAKILLPKSVIAVALGSLIISTACTELYNAAKKINEFKNIELNASVIAQASLEEMERQRDVLKKIYEDERIKDEERFILGYKQMHEGALNGSVQDVVEGLGNVLDFFSKDVMYKTQEGFDRDFFSDKEFNL